MVMRGEVWLVALNSTLGNETQKRQSCLLYAKIRGGCAQIDKTFVDTVGRKAASSSVSQHISAMARELGVEIVAEVIDHEE